LRAKVSKIAEAQASEIENMDKIKTLTQEKAQLVAKISQLEPESAVVAGAKVVADALADGEAEQAVLAKVKAKAKVKAETEAGE